MNTTPENLIQTLKDLQLEFQHKLPPVENWHPELSGDIDICIDREGHWFHEGGRITRDTMVKMFSSILKREGNEYFLVTPVEKWRIRVDEAPFIFLNLRQQIENSKSAIILTTNTGHDVLVNEEYPFYMEHANNAEPRPMCRVYRNLCGLLSRNVYYQLVELCEPEKDKDGVTELVFYSEGTRFSLGPIE